MPYKKIKDKIIGKLMRKGVLVASDSHMEWLLPWWWERYSCCNEFPVVFVDLGMTSEARLWCQERGEVLTVTEVFSFDTVIKEWEEVYGSSYGQARKAWFKKPLACLLSPFEETIWMDLDCEVLSSIEPIFAYLEGKELAIALDRVSAIPEGFSPEDNLESQLIFNGGVIAYRKGSHLIKEWARIALAESHLYWGDDYILSTLIHQGQEKIQILPPIYNWRLADGTPFYAKIIHWCGEWGKACIAKQGGLKGLLEGLPELKRVFDV